MARISFAFVQDASGWERDIHRLSRFVRGRYQRPDQRHGSRAEACRQAAATARLWGVPVGIVTTVRREP